MKETEITHESAARSFETQLFFASSNYTRHSFNQKDFDNIVICGLGGSGIGGKLAKNYFSEKSNLPIEVISSYELPHYVNERSFVILSSYSGNTEETITMFHEALSRNSTCIAISTGGAIEQISLNNKVPFYKVTKGYQPRMALGFSFSFLLLILGELMEIDTESTLKETIEKIKTHSSQIENRGNEILQFFQQTLKNKFVFVSGDKLSSVALRSCQQIQENAKAEAFYHVLPECNHNVTETYYGSLKSNFIFLKGLTHQRTDHRFGFLKTLLENNNNKVYVLEISEDSLYGILEMILTLDWLSINLSNELKVNNMEVPNIDNLKQFLAEIN